jgi:hypothetical protein
MIKTHNNINPAAKNIWDNSFLTLNNTELIIPNRNKSIDKNIITFKSKEFFLKVSFFNNIIIGLGIITIKKDDKNA